MKKQIEEAEEEEVLAVMNIVLFSLVSESSASVCVHVEMYFLSLLT